MIRRLIPSLRASQKTLRLQVLCFRRSAPPRLILRARQALRFLLLPKPPVRPPDFRVRQVPARALRRARIPSLSGLYIYSHTPTICHRQSICFYSRRCSSEAHRRHRSQVPQNRRPCSLSDRLCRLFSRSCPVRRCRVQSSPLGRELCQAACCSAYRKVCFPLISPQFIYAYMLKKSDKSQFLCFAASNMRIPAATEALREFILPRIGREAMKSHFSRTRRPMPLPSEPMTRAMLPL